MKRKRHISLILLLCFMLVNLHCQAQINNSGLNYNELTQEQLNLAALQAHKLNEIGGIMSLTGGVGVVIGYITKRNSINVFLGGHGTASSTIDKASLGNGVMIVGGITALIGVVLKLKGSFAESNIAIARAKFQSSLQLKPLVFTGCANGMGVSAIITIE